MIMIMKKWKGRTQNDEEHVHKHTNFDFLIFCYLKLISKEQHVTRPSKPLLHPERRREQPQEGTLHGRQPNYPGLRTESGYEQDVWRGYHIHASSQSSE